MSEYKFSTDISEPMYGSFTKEYPDQFITKRKANTIHLFKIVGISDNGLTIKSLLDKHTDLVPFEEIVKIKNYQTGEIVKADKFIQVTKQEILAQFMEKGDEPIKLTVKSGESFEIDVLFDELAVKKTGVEVITCNGDVFTLDTIYKHEASISFGA